MPGPSTTERRLRRKLAANVRRLRNERGLTLEEAAHRGGMAWRQWQRVEAGDVSATLRTLARVSEALEVEAGHLLL